MDGEAWSPALCWRALVLLVLPLLLLLNCFCLRLTAPQPPHRDSSTTLTLFEGESSVLSVNRNAVLLFPVRYQAAYIVA